MIVAVRHFAIEVSNIVPAFKFYQSLGFQLFYHALENWSGEAGKEVRHIVKLRLPSGGALLEIIERVPHIDMAEKPYANTHICLQCTDIEATCKDLESKGCTVVTPLRPSPDKTVMLAFYKDPFGLTLELVELQNAERGDNTSASGIEEDPQQESGEVQRILNFRVDDPSGTQTSVS
jgi:predicted enzyme related to lactoylglutathione lyase